MLLQSLMELTMLYTYILLYSHRILVISGFSVMRENMTMAQEDDTNGNDLNVTSMDMSTQIPTTIHDEITDTSIINNTKILGLYMNNSENISINRTESHHIHGQIYNTSLPEGVTTYINVNTTRTKLKKRFHNYRLIHDTKKKDTRKKQTEFYAWIFGGTMAALALISTSVSCVVFCFCGGERWRYIKRMRVDEQGEYHRVNNVNPPPCPQDLEETEYPQDQAEEGSNPSNSVTVI